MIEITDHRGNSAKELLSFYVEKRGYKEVVHLYYILIDEDEIELYQKSGDNTLFLETVFIYRICDIANVTKVVISTLSQLLLETVSIRISYRKSNYYPNEEFDEMLQKAKESFDFEAKMDKQQESEVIKLCDTLNLNPEYANKVDSWYARCPSRKEHFINLDINADLWKCNHCNKQGGLIELRAWNIELNNNKNFV